MAAILGITFPIYAALGLGYLFVWKGIFSQSDIKSLGAFVFNLALPGLIFTTLAQRDPVEVFQTAYVLPYLLGGVINIAVAYALIVSFFVLRSMNMRDLVEVLTKSALSTSAVLLLVGAAVAFKTVVSLSYAPQIMSDYILSLSQNPLILLFLINILLFIVGMFLDAGPAIIILGPILGPIFVDLGVHPVHFAIIMSVNLTVGLATPPMGLVLFVASTVSGEKVETISRAILPFLAVEVLVIFLITYVPAISMTVPYLTGFLGCGPDVGFSACISPTPIPN